MIVNLILSVKDIFKYSNTKLQLLSIVFVVSRRQVTLETKYSALSTRQFVIEVVFFTMTQTLIKIILFELCIDYCNVISLFIHCP